MFEVCKRLIERYPYIALGFIGVFLILSPMLIHLKFEAITLVLKDGKPTQSTDWVFMYSSVFMTMTKGLTITGFIVVQIAMILQFSRLRIGRSISNKGLSNREQSAEP